MHKNSILYIAAFVLITGTIFFFNRSYRKLSDYSELSGRYNMVYGHYQKLFGEISNDANLNPEIVKLSNSEVDPKLFFTDSQIIFKQLSLLRSVVRDSINVRIAEQLDSAVRVELPWLLTSNVQDSIINHNVPKHIASFITIDSLINAGSQRTMFLSETGKKRLLTEINNARTWMILFVILSGVVLIYTTISFFRQRSIRKGGEVLFSSIINSSDDAILSKNLQGIITSWNHGAQNVFGYSPGEIIGEHISRLIPAYLRDEEHDIMQKIIRGEGINHYETERIKKDGTIINVSLTISAVKDAAGKIIGASKIARDITQQKKTAEEIVNAYKEKETVLNRINDSVVSVDNDWRYTFLNDAAMSTHPFSKEETLGKVIWDVHPEMAGTVFWDKYHEAMLTKKVVEVESYYAPMHTWFNVKVYPSADGLTIFYKDFTASKKAEEKLFQTSKEIADYKFALDEASIVSIADDKGIITYVNNNFCKISKYSYEELIGQDHRIINSGYHPKEFIRNLWATITNGKIWKGELKNKAKDGSFYWVEATIVPFLNEEGKAYQYLAIRTDITDRKRTEENIKATLKEISEYKYALDESAIVAITDQKGIIKYANNNFCKISKYTAKELIGQDHRIINSGYHPKEFIRDLWVTIAKGKIWKGELKNKAKDGTIYWVDTTIVPFVDEKGKPYQYIAIRADITERKNAEEELASNELRFRSLIENSAEGIALTDEFSNVTYWSPASKRIIGVPPKENIISLSHPEDQETIKERREKVLKNPGVPIPFQGRFLHGNGHYFWMEGTFTNLLNVAGVNAIVANYRDISQRKEDEEKLVKSEKIYKTIASSIPGSVICLLDNECRYLLVEGDMIEKLGYSKQRLLGNKIKDVLIPGVLEEIQQDFAGVFAGETITRESVSNGYDIISRFIPLKDENNMVYAIMTVAIDVTDLKNAQRDIAELNRGLEEKIISRTEQLKKSNEELEAFTYSVSHDLRAPLRGIIGFAAILEEDYASQLDDEARRVTDVIKRNALKMGNLIDDLLAFSRMGRDDLIKTNIDSLNMVQEVVSELQPQNGNANIDWVIGELPTIKGDINTMRQVWINFISNAIKYSGHNENPRIEIGTLKQGDQTVFFVKDNGIGFDMQYSNKLFKVFQRLHSAEEFEGTGVGLALAGKIVYKHGGKVWAEAAVNKGATFFFSLPETGNHIKHKSITQ